MRIVQISDTHLTALGGVTNRNFETLVKFINDELQPDLIINTGDVAILSPDSDEDRETARVLHTSFKAPLRVLPGNHDVGEAGDHPWAGINVTSERVQAFRTAFGHDRFVDIVRVVSEAGSSEWAIIGINSEILSSGIPEEAEQWAWLEELAPTLNGRPTMLFMHKPMWSPLAEPSEHNIAISDEARVRLLSIFADADLRSVGSGHLHCYRVAKVDGVTTVFAPSTAFVVRVESFAMGLVQLGVVEYTIEGETVMPRFRSVSNLEEGEPWQHPEFVAAWEKVNAGPLPVYA